MERRYAGGEPEAWVKRELALQEKNAGWEIFKGVYWGIYLFVLSIGIYEFFIASYTFNSLPAFFVIATASLAIMLMIYGFTKSLHYRLMERIG